MADVSPISLIKPRYLRGLLFGFALTQVNHAIADKTVLVGNASGQSQAAKGPITALVVMTPCRFSMTLTQDQWLQFNSPDLVFVATKQLPNTLNAPQLWQASSSNSAEWNFEKSAGLSEPWFGVMCENAGNFSALTAQKLPSDDSIEVQLLREANNLKCPATLTDHGWSPTLLAGDPQTYTFESLEGTKSSGFIIGYHDKSRRLFSRITFCLMHNEQVLIGSAESGSSAPLAISAEGFEKIKTAVRSITFE
ncbi:MULTISPECIES: hypothetical protein [unclassified Pseudomonas]|uniref:hypothetical protein n=1 Tax=unclassified Pseudomonas TaxID=196821 RepID=UPI001EECCE0A|nr:MULTISPECIES: hypothetical protein [unclassified Pseudomonas]